MEKLLTKYLSNLEGLGWNLLAALIILVIGYAIVKVVDHLINRIIEKSSTNTMALSFIDSAVTIMLWLIIIVIALSQLGISMTPLTSIITVGAAGIALAFKESLSGVIDGVMIAFAKPFEQGDLIEIDGVKGKIQSITLLYTFLLTLDNRKVVIPNSTMAHSTIINYSSQTYRRVDISFQVAYPSDLTQVYEITKDIAKQNSYLPAEMEPIVQIISFDDSGITVEVRSWAETANFENCRTSLITEINRRLPLEGIEIPYNKLDVYLQKND